MSTTTWQTRLVRLLILPLLAMSFAPWQPPAQASGAIFYNPIIGHGADPSIIHHDGYYYLVQSDGDIWVTQSSSLTRLGTGRRVKVWDSPDSGSYCCNVWAPELQLINGRFYIYFAADDGNNDNHRMYVLESNGGDPQGSYTFRGKLAAPTDRWAIDGAVLQHGSALYFVWSGWEGTTNIAQHLYIAPMSNPYTISGERVKISSPTNSWERIGGPPYINEAPQPLIRNGKVFIIYSASGSWTDDYCLGRLTAAATADVLQASSWSKSDGCVFAKRDTAYGPGHNTFTRSPDGSEDWLVYHANISSGTGWSGRSIRAQKFGWDANGYPVFGSPAAVYDATAVPAGESAAGPVPNGTYKILAKNSGKALDVAGCSTTDGANVIIWDYWGGDCQRWELADLGNGYYRILAKNSGKSLDVSGCSSASGADVIIWPYWGGDCQLWNLQPQGDGTYRITPKVSGKALDVDRCSTSSGADVIIWDYWAGDCQRWWIQAP